MERLAGKDLAVLVQYASAMLQWLRRNDSDAGELFFGAALDVDPEEAHAALKSVLKLHNKEHGVTAESLTTLLDTKPAAVWARGVYILFTGCNPPIAATAEMRSLTEALAAADGGVGVSEKDASRIAGPVVKALGEDRCDALYELCVTLRDTALDPELTAFALAPSVLLRADDPEGDSDAARKHAKSALSTLVEHADAIWGKQSATAVPTPTRGPRYTEATLSPKETVQHREHLKAFFEWRAPLSVGIVDELFRNFELPDIARGVFSKYGLVPPEWRDKLQQLRDGGAPDMGWFVAAKAEKPKRLSLAPRINRKPASRPRGVPVTQADRLIDEIIATEVSYADTMVALNENFVAEIQAIADGKLGDKARLELGLTDGDVRQIFGDRLTNVIEVSAHLLAQLDLVGLVTIPPHDPVGRPGIVGRIFAEHAEELRVYAPYISSHMSSMKSLKAAAAACDKASERQRSGGKGKTLKSRLGGSSGKHGSGNAHDGPKNFVQLWHELSQLSRHLQGHTLESILIQPVQRVPRYKLLLESLLKEVPKADPGHPAIPILEEALDKVKRAAKQINTAVKQHMKLEAIFGQDQMMTPNASIARKDGEGNFLAIVNSYVG